MYNFTKKTIQLTVLTLVTLSFQACSVKIPIKTPTISEKTYPKTTNGELSIKFENHLPIGHKVASGLKIFILEHNKKSIKASQFLETALKNELSARNIPLHLTSSSDNKLLLNDFSVITHRVSGFSPLVTISTLKIKLKTESGIKTLASMVKRAKTPIWTMNEVNDPCYNEPITLLIKEIVSKINKNYFGNRFTDDYVKTLQEKISKNINEKPTYLDVYELGFSNNIKSLEFLKTLTKNENEYIRLSAISSIGTIGDINQFDFLVELHKTSTMWQDKAMALKSIGDLNTDKSNAYLKEEKVFWKDKTSKEALWTLKVLNLYLK